MNTLPIFYSFALDTAALLGGNEYLINQMLDEIEQLEYNEKELSVLRWALTEVIMRGFSHALQG